MTFFFLLKILLNRRFSFFDLQNYDLIEKNVLQIINEVITNNQWTKNEYEASKNILMLLANQEIKWHSSQKCIL